VRHCCTVVGVVNLTFSLKRRRSKKEGVVVVGEKSPLRVVVGFSGNPPPPSGGGHWVGESSPQNSVKTWMRLMLFHHYIEHILYFIFFPFVE
jgi:hypothetical protein